MKSLTVDKGLFFLFGSIMLISNQLMSNMFKLYANLILETGIQLYFD